MRDYGKISPQFWIGSTGKTLRASGPEAMIVAMYLITNPQANMLGLYYLPLISIAHETGLGMEGALKGLERACEGGFCAYDEQTEVVWVYEMARFQIADQLKPEDNRVKGIQNEYTLLPSNPFLPSFFEKYKDAFHLTNKRDFVYKKASPCEAPCKPLRSQEQEQEQEQDINNTLTTFECLSPPQGGDETRTLSKKSPNCPYEKIKEMYHQAFPGHPGVSLLKGKRKTSLRARWADSGERLLARGELDTVENRLAWWKNFFARAAQSDFLRGKKPFSDGSVYLVDFDKLISPGGFLGVIEGKYDNREAA